MRSGSDRLSGGRVVRAVLGGLVIPAAVALLAACASTADTPPWVTGPNRCTVLLGGGGMVFPDSALNDRWFTINKTLSGDLADALAARGYRIDTLIVRATDNEARLKAVITEMDRSTCNKVVQVAHALVGPGQVAESFQFTITILGVAPTARGIGLTGQYEKTYTYPLTKEVMETLSLSGLAATMAADIERSGLLARVGG